MSISSRRLKQMSNLTGFNARRNKAGVIVVSCHYSSDPDKNEHWVERTSKGYPESSWAREMEMSRETMEGQRVYPAYKKQIHSPSPLEYDPHEPIFRGWDFGFHHPACVWMQLNHKDQICVLAELMGDDVTIEEFIAQVRFKESEIFRHNGADHVNFVDWGDPAGNQRSDKMSRNMIKDENTTIGIMRKFNIRVQSKRYPIETRVNLIRSLMEIRKDGLPGILFDPIECSILIQGFLGGYVCEEDKTNEIPKERPKKDGHFDHLQDSLQYVVAGIVDPRTRQITSSYAHVNYDAKSSMTYEDKEWAYYKNKKQEQRMNIFNPRRRWNVTGY